MVPILPPDCVVQSRRYQYCYPLAAFSAAATTTTAAAKKMATMTTKTTATTTGTRDSSTHVTYFGIFTSASSTLSPAA